MTNGNRKDDKQGERREEKTAAMATKEEEKVKPTAASTGEEDSKASAKKLMPPPTAAAKKLAESDAIQAAVKAGNINIHREEHTEIMDLTEESKEAQEEHARLLKKVETERRARTIAVPTKAEEVSRKLRELGQPIRLFGEKPADIRERLQRFVAAAEMEEEETEKVDTMVKPKPSFTPRRMQMAGETADAAAKRVGVAAAGAGSATALPKKGEAVYTPASGALLEARKAIATTSFARAKARLVGVKRRRGNADEALAVDRRASETFATMRQLVINSSQFADDRPLSAIQVSPDGGTVASGSWTCLVKLWDFESLEMRKLLRGHTERVTGIAWHPNAYTSDKALLASGAADKSAKVWDCESGECVQTLHGHAGRLARIGFHPTGRYLGTASFDHTWRLWDVETGDELLLQDGHHKEVYGISFQADGALVATGDLGGTARVWDLRSGRSVWTMEGHVKRITCVDFSPCCYEVATGSDDHTVRIWDIRKQRCAYTLPAHSALVSDVRYGRASGEVLVSASFDNSAKVWSTRDWSLLRTLSGHEGKLTGCDVTPNERKIVTCSFDRTVKVWAHQDEF